MVQRGWDRRPHRLLARFQLLQRDIGMRFRERRERQRIRAYLVRPDGDRELMDIGMMRGEVDYVASNRDTDPRGI